MNKIIFKLGINLVIGAALLTSSAISANSWNGYSNCCHWLQIDGCWELGAAALYQQHCAQNFTFATDPLSTSLVFRGTSYNVHPKFYWGFRLWGGWYSCDGCSFANLTWKHLWSNKDKRRVSGPLSIPNLTFAAVVAQGRQRLQYDTVYLRGGRTLFCGCDSRFYAYSGLRYVGAEIRREIKAHTGDVGTKTANRSYFQGGGVEVGVGGEYGLGCSFNLIGTFSGIALVGNRNETFTTIDGNGVLNYFPDHNMTKCVPGVDFRVGVNYTYDWCGCGCNLRIVAELGWEMDYYWNILVLRDQLSLISGVFVDFPRISPVNFGTNGPYGSLTVRF